MIGGELKFRRGMKKWYLWLIGVVVVLLVLREFGVFDFNAHVSKSMSVSSNTIESPGLNATGVVYEEERPPAGKMLRQMEADIQNHEHSQNEARQNPKSREEQKYEEYLVCVRYHIVSDFTLWQWMPLYKNGISTVRLSYVLTNSYGNASLGYGYVELASRQTMMGICSAREYREALVKPMIEVMKKDVEKKINRMTAN
jgi:hypothetical protein